MELKAMDLWRIFTIFLTVCMIPTESAGTNKCKKEKSGTCRRHFSCKPYKDEHPIFEAGLCPYWKPFCCLRAHCVNVLGNVCRKRKKCSSSWDEKNVGWYGCPYHHKHCCKPVECVSSRQGRCRSKCWKGEVQDGNKECPKSRKRCCRPICYSLGNSYCRNMCEYNIAWNKGPRGCKPPFGACCEYRTRRPCEQMGATCRSACKYGECAQGRLNCAEGNLCCRPCYPVQYDQQPQAPAQPPPEPQPPQYPGMPLLCDTPPCYAVKKDETADTEKNEVEKTDKKQMKDNTTKKTKEHTDKDTAKKTVKKHIKKTKDSN